MPIVLRCGSQGLVHQHLEQVYYRPDTPSKSGYVEAHPGAMCVSLEQNAEAQSITYLDANFVLETAKKTWRALPSGAGGCNYHQRITGESPWL
jgi:hypothetical protein